MALATASMESWVGKDKIVVQAQGDSRRSDFYTVDLRLNQLTKVAGGFLWNHNIHYGVTAAASVIYAIGNPFHYFNRRYPEKPDADVDPDDYHNHAGASFLDLKDPECRWKNIGGMLNWYRSYPACAALGDKIFVFGALVNTSLSPFGEFYDKKNGIWKAIPMSGIDHKMKIHRPIVSDPRNNRLIVYFDYITSLYAYYPDNNHQWICLDEKMVSFTGEPASSTVDDVIYFVICNTDFSNCITAYDILTKDCLEVSWSSCSPFGPVILDRLGITQMLHLGNNILCLTHYFTSSGDYFWEYYRFQVSRVSQQKVLLTPLSVHCLPSPVDQGRNSPLNTIAL